MTRTPETQAAHARGTQALEPAAKLARALTPVARWICFLSIAAAGVLSYALWKWLDLSTYWAVVTALLLGAPALLYAFVWWLLSALGEMRERVHGAVGAAQTAASNVVATDVGAGRKLWRSLGDALRLADQADNVWLPVGSVLMLANPVGLLVLGAAFAAALVLWVVALGVGFVLLF